MDCTLPQVSLPKMTPAFRRNFQQSERLTLQVCKPFHALGGRQTQGIFRQRTFVRRFKLGWRRAHLSRYR